MDSKYIDWSEHQESGGIDFDCPYCGGTGRKAWEDLDEDEKKTVKDECEDYKDWYELTVEEKKIVTDAFCNTEDRNESDKVCPDAGDVIEYYNDNSEDFQFFAEDVLEDFYDNSLGSYGDFNFYCEECDEGFIEPMMNYAYPLKYTEVNDENKKTALDCGLFLFEDDEGVWMSLTGCGMDLSPNILKAYRLLDKYIPSEWAIEWQQDYKAYLSEEDHRLNAEACKQALEGDMRSETEKLKAINLYLKEPEYVKKKQEEKMEQFNNCLGKASKIDDELVRGLTGISCFLKSNKEITE